MSLSCAHLTHRLPTRTLYQDLSGDFPSQCVTAIIGPNGAGKSTLLRHLAGIEAPQTGSVFWNGSPLGEMPPRLRARTLAYLPQDTTFIYDLTVRDAVMLGRAPHRPRFAPPSRHDQQAVDEALHRVGVADLTERGVLTLSGGERQRVNLARMLATGAEVLLLDEPTTSLDVGHALRLLELLRELATQGHTVVIAMHELSWARRYAAQTLCLGGDARPVWGTTHQVMTPARLSHIFQVRVEETDGEVIFYSKESTAP